VSAPRVLTVSWEYPPVIAGGLARHVCKLSERLARDGVDVHVLTRADGPGGTEHRHGVTVHRVAEPDFPRQDIDAFIAWVQRMNGHMRTAALALDDGFDLVHSHDWLVAAAAGSIAREWKVPWVVTVHATEYGRHGGWVRRHPQSHIHAQERRMVRGADRLIACSAYMREHVAEAFGIDPEPIAVIPNGIDAGDLQPVADLPALRARFAAPDERLVLLVGRLVHEKGFHLALDAVRTLDDRIGGIRFVVAGSGMAEAGLRAQARELGLAGKGTFIGWTGDEVLNSLYRIADLCVVPSIYEPFGLVALEAMASGCPCVVADTGGLREVVPAGRKVGLRFRASDSASLARMAEELLGDDALRDRLVAQAREHVLQFDWTEVARRTETLYDELRGANLKRAWHRPRT